MENNADKEMRDKLRRVELPFDPAAWEQMDAMLEKDRKPKAFIWWWFGGVAACLMLGMGIYGYQQYTNRENTTNAIAVNANKQSDGTAVAVKAGKQTVGTAKSTSINKAADNELNTTGAATKEPSDAIHQPQSKTEAATKTNSRSDHEIATASNKTAGKSFVKTDKAADAFVSRNAENNVAKGTRQKKTAKQTKEMLHKSNMKLQQLSYTNISADEQSNEARLANIGTSETARQMERITNTGIEPVIAADNMPAMIPGALSASGDNMEDGMKKKEGEEPDLKKLKKKIPFAFSLGVAANLTGTTLGHQTGGSLFYSKPSYMVGVMEEFMFLKRVAVSAGVMFSQTSFGVYNPMTTDGVFTPVSYTSDITELNIPIGIKAYAVSKDKIRFYMGAGIINHIKLKETFTYSYPYNAAFAIGGVVQPSSLSNSFSAQSRASNIDFSINQAKRYYASFYTSAGAEFIVKKHLVFFTEPLFYMSLMKIGVQNKFKYNLGLSGGVRYQF